MENSILTAKDLVNEITKIPKYYTHAIPQYNINTAFRIVEAIRSGTCKPSTQNAFFKAFGYVVAGEVMYVQAIKHEIIQSL